MHLLCLSYKLYKEHVKTFITVVILNTPQQWKIIYFGTKLKILKKLQRENFREKKKKKIETRLVLQESNFTAQSEWGIEDVKMKQV